MQACANRRRKEETPGTEKVMHEICELILLSIGMGINFFFYQRSVLAEFAERQFLTVNALKFETLTTIIVNK